MNDRNGSTVPINRNVLATCWTSAGNVSPATQEQRSPELITNRVNAVAATGWTGMGIHHADLPAVRNQLGYATLKKMLDDNGITTIELEFLTDWWTTGKRRSASDQLRRELFDAANALGANVLKVAPNLDGSEVPQVVLLDQFGSLAADAESAGLYVALEPMPFSNINTIEAGVELVLEVAHPHGGLAVDSWHTAKGGTTYSALVGLLPMEYVFLVELADGTTKTQGSFAEDAVFGRLDPGEGELDVQGFVVALHEAGYRGHWGVEIMSDAHRAVPIRDALSRTFAHTQQTIDRAQAQLIAVAPNLY
jgi:sugar phosphate isomerase/epimerase